MTSLSSFFTVQKKPTQSVLCLQGAEFPLLFGRAFAEQFSQQIGMPFAYQSMQAENQGAALAALQTSFLGAASCYWLGSFDELSKSKQKVWMEFFQNYTGPHTLILFSTSSLGSSSNIVTIPLPESVNGHLLQTITTMLGSTKVSFQAELYRQTDKLSLDQAYLLVKYDAVLGKGAAEFAHDWLPEMIVPEISLFSLSQALFDGKASSFFRLWKQLSHKYAAPFWIAFWSEQMWRAYHYILLQKKGKQAEAKKAGYRLPFSFLNRTWRKYSLEDLKTYHHFLYDIDFHIKNGGSECSLDLFYATVFA